MLLAAYLHRLNPFAWEFAEGVGIRWYGLSYVAGFVLAWWIIRSLARRGRSPLAPEQAGDLIVAVAIGTVVGGRLGYCLLYQPSLLVGFSSSPPFWSALAIHQGGMASHGGITGLILACFWYAKRHTIGSLRWGEATLHLMDLTAITSCLGLCFGRMANFINGELYGRPCADDLPWAVHFPQELAEWSPQDPRLVSEGFLAVRDRVAELGLFAPRPGSGCSCAVGGSDTDIILTAVRSDEQTAALIQPLLEARHPSQIYEALLEGLLLLVILWFIWRITRRRGMVAAGFLVIYPILRAIGEQFRMPDAHIGFDALGLTRGQELSGVMLVIGLVCWAFWVRRPLGPDLAGERVAADERG